MRIKNFKRWVAGLCAATMLAGVPAMVGYAEQTGSKELDDTNPGNETSVTINVAEAAPVTYVVQIPETVDFGTIQQPNSSETSYLTQPITVTCTNLTGLASGQTLAVLVKDKYATDRSDPFKLTKDSNPDVVMTYSMFNTEGNNIQDLVWYSNGFLFGAFTAAGQSVENELKLDVSQLYGKDLTVWGGEYSGTLNFRTSITSIGNVNPMSMTEGEPVV